MLQFIRAVDMLSTWIGHAFAWCVMAMTLGIGYEVFVRNVFDDTDGWAFKLAESSPWLEAIFLSDSGAWAYDLSYIMYGTLFMMAGAYTLSRGGHVRGDVFYHKWRPRTQARVELVLYLIFFFPAVITLIFAGWDYAAKSMSYNGGAGEVSSFSPNDVPIWQFKLIIPAAGLLLLIQGLAQICRCLICLQTGSWPPLIHDVEETETILKHHAESEDTAGTITNEPTNQGGVK
ncbi:MAG: TRAP transporter small permease subunit [Hyphomicrobiaceae bacterium]